MLNVDFIANYKNRIIFYIKLNYLGWSFMLNLFLIGGIWLLNQLIKYTRKYSILDT
jgi:hypothetical protein